MTGETYSSLMLRALELAERGRYGAGPNPLVGALVLDEAGNVVGEGGHLVCGGPHAEVLALEAAGAGARNGTVVVTLEPCAHQGRTPPCVDALLAAGIRRVVVGCLDTNPKVAGGGVERLKSAGLEVIVGVEEQSCRTLNRRFFHWVTCDRPFVSLKMAMTLDGKLAARGGASRWITGEPARKQGHMLREEYDAILVGVGTVLADNPRLVRHLGLNPEPDLLRAVLDSRLRTPLTARLVQEGARNTVLFCTPAAPARQRRELEAAGVTVVEVAATSDRCDLWQALRWLSSHGVSSLLVEGGGEVHWSFLQEGLVQRVHAYVAPMLLGGREAVPAVGGVGFSSPHEALKLSFVQMRQLGEDLELVAEVGGV